MTFGMNYVNRVTFELSIFCEECENFTCDYNKENDNICNECKEKLRDEKINDILG